MVLEGTFLGQLACIKATLSGWDGVFRIKWLTS